MRNQIQLPRNKRKTAEEHISFFLLFWTFCEFWHSWWCLLHLVCFNFFCFYVLVENEKSIEHLINEKFFQTKRVSMRKGQTYKIFKIRFCLIFMVLVFGFISSSKKSLYHSFSCIQSVFCCCCCCNSVVIFIFVLIEFTSSFFICA